MQWSLCFVLLSPVNICSNNWKNRWMRVGLLHWCKSRRQVNSLGEICFKSAKHLIYHSLYRSGILAASFDSESPTRLQPRCGSGLWSSQGLTRGRIHFQDRSCGFWKIEFFLCCWTKGFNSSLAACQNPLSCPCYIGLSMGQLTT